MQELVRKNLWDLKIEGFNDFTLFAQSAAFGSKWTILDVLDFEGFPFGKLEQVRDNNTPLPVVLEQYKADGTLLRKWSGTLEFVGYQLNGLTYAECQPSAIRLKFRGKLTLSERVD